MKKTNVSWATFPFKSDDPPIVQYPTIRTGLSPRGTCYSFLSLSFPCLSFAPLVKVKPEIPWVRV